MRTDIHRPSSAVFDPEDYFPVGVFDLASPQTTSFDLAVQAQAKAGRHVAAHQQSGQCGHCGAHIRYAALMLHAPTAELILIGETCLDNRFESLTKAEFQALREAAKLAAEKRKAEDAVNTFLAEHPEVSWILTEEAEVHYIVSDIARKLRRYGSLSQPQINLCLKLRKEVAEKQIKAAQQAQATQDLLEAGVKVPSGKTQITGEVVSTKVQDSAYGTTYKMLVVSPSGWKVWGTIPRVLDLAEGIKGRHVSFTATVSPSDQDPLFGFYSRPTKASFTD